MSFLALDGKAVWIHTDFRRRQEHEPGVDPPVRAARETGAVAVRLLDAHPDRWEHQLEARVRERTDEVRRLLGGVIHAQEEERHRLARDLHDDTAQTVATLLVHMATLRDTLPAGQEHLREMLDRVLAQGARALADRRRLIADLRPTVLDDLGLIPALRAYADERLAAAGVKLDFLIAGAPHRLDRAIETALFRILQEAVTNVARHARATTATISITFGPGNRVAFVSGDGRAFDTHRPAASDHRTGVGREGMRERADLIRARLDVASAPGADTSVRVEVPPEETDG